MTDLHAIMSRHVERGAVPGLVTAVVRGGETTVDAIGTTTFAGAGHDEPPRMRRDTLFRITSMTKPITAVAVLMLVEDGLLRLDEPVDRLLPELADRRVLTRPDGPLDDTVAAARAITVEDLLSNRWGFGIDLDVFPGAPVFAAAAELGLAIGPPIPPTPHRPDEWLRRLGTLPLLTQPGERWLYDTAADVLGVLVERASGTPFPTFLRRRILDPLGMSDTGFSVPAPHQHRLTTCYGDDPETGAATILDDGGHWNAPPVFPSGGAGLVSTVDDYLAFATALAGSGAPLLSTPTLRRMTTDVLTPAQRGSVILDDRGWGLGIAVDAVGRFGWDGGFGTTFFVDPRTGGVAVLLTQRLLSGPLMALLADFRAAAESLLAPVTRGATG